ncbi:hypothetical protein FEM48_Zijuj05G0129700 [Ziziphus jujuba var. spinosa]|uniref:Uncharacterized protein n=1 Tax=Ziziphus jujuba var. spinosa TaxID=714518 RepID=A0A978VEY9_ZIZJJ|nr:hypothetical protein FEM48_Zijuj05G0129700 [Ziziphus jujuba var. spinosa]
MLARVESRILCAPWEKFCGNDRIANNWFCINFSPSVQDNCFCCYEIPSFAFGLNMWVSSLTWFKLVFAIQVVASQDWPETSDTRSMTNGAAAGCGGMGGRAGTRSMQAPGLNAAVRPLPACILCSA